MLVCMAKKIMLGKNVSNLEDKTDTQDNIISGILKTIIKQGKQVQQLLDDPKKTNLRLIGIRQKSKDIMYEIKNSAYRNYSRNLPRYNERTQHISNLGKWNPK